MPIGVTNDVDAGCRRRAKAWTRKATSATVATTGTATGTTMMMSTSASVSARMIVWHRTGDLVMEFTCSQK